MNSCGLHNSCYSIVSFFASYKSIQNENSLCNFYFNSVTFISKPSTAFFRHLCYTLLRNFDTYHGDASPKGGTTLKTYTLHFIRHGMTTGNAEGRYVGHQDLELSLPGREELEYLKDTCVYPDPPVVFTSPLKRCLETCEVLFPGVEPVIIRDLIEYNFGEFEGHTAEELQQYDEFAAWLSGGMDAAPPHGESNAEFGERIRSALENIVEGLLKTGITEAAIVTHGGIISVLMALYCLPEAPASEWVCMNGAGFTVRITPSLWSKGRKFEGVAQVPAVPEETLKELGLYDEDEDWVDDADVDYGFGPDTTGTEHFTI